MEELIAQTSIRWEGHFQLLTQKRKSLLLTM